jgi:hypothetical protein
MTPWLPESSSKRWCTRWSHWPHPWMRHLTRLLRPWMRCSTSPKHPLNQHLSRCNVVLRLWLTESRPWRLNCQFRQLTQMLLQLTHMLTVIHSLKIQGLTMISTLSFLILLHANDYPSTDKVWEVIKIITANTMFATMILLLKLNFLSLLLMARMMLWLI